MMGHEACRAAQQDRRKLIFGTEFRPANHATRISGEGDLSLQKRPQSVLAGNGITSEHWDFEPHRPEALDQRSGTPMAVEHHHHQWGCAALGHGEQF
jgi:hypothetical protein